MVNHSAEERAHAPHAISSTETNTQNLSVNLKRRAQSIINNRSIDAETRAIIRYGLEINDPALSELVRRVDAGESIVDTNDVVDAIDDSLDEKIEALVDIVCSADEPGERSAALLVLMATLENAPHPKLLVNAAKHLAFTRCGELNVYGLVDAQIALIEGELF